MSKVGRIAAATAGPDALLLVRNGQEAAFPARVTLEGI